MSRFRFVVCLFVLLLVVTVSPQVSAEELQVVMITPYGEGVPFGDAAYQGLLDIAEEYSLNVRLIEAREQSEYQPQMRAMADLGYDVIIALHDYFAEDMVVVAQSIQKYSLCLLTLIAEAELR